MSALCMEWQRRFLSDVVMCLMPSSGDSSELNKYETRMEKPLVCAVLSTRNTKHLHQILVDVCFYELPVGH